MKKLMMILAMLVAIATAAPAMSYREAKAQALFLADKMAYELNLTDEQHEAAYEINLDYLMAVEHRSHLYGSYWSRRNSLFRSVLAPWQYNAYLRAEYFYRPVYWANNTWCWRIYNRYNHTRFYRSRPSAFVTYRGGRPISYYQQRNWHRSTPTRRYGRDDMYMRQRSNSSHHDHHGRRSHHNRYNGYEDYRNDNYRNRDYRKNDERRMRKEQKKREKEFRHYNRKFDHDNRGYRFERER